MLLKDAGIVTRTVNALGKKNIHTVDDLLRTFPRTYLDYREFISLDNAVGKDCPIVGYFESIEKKSGTPCSMIIAHIIEETTGKKVRVQWFGQNQLWQLLSNFIRLQVVVCGRVSYDPKYGYSVTNPMYFEPKENFCKRIVPVYTKIKDFSEDMRTRLLRDFTVAIEEPIENIVIEKTKLPSYKDAICMIHHPKQMEDIEKGEKRLIFNDMLYFSLNIKERSKDNCIISPYIAKNFSVTNQFIQDLPYTLTDDQTGAIDSIKNKMTTGKRANYLIQGDVGCGKTAVAFISMFMMADNGYQSVIMAPTVVLAKQHYDELKEYANKYNFNIAFLSGDIKGKQRSKVLSDIESGKTNFIVGTHGLFQKDVIYKNLGLVVTDEEHRFGVIQREALEQKAKNGAHIISMSATPIPRSLANIIYGEDKEVYVIKQMPNGRKPIQTAINSSDRVIYDFIEKQLKEGRQCYVICPLINEADEESKCTGLESIEETLKKYHERFDPTGFKISSVNGHMLATEIEEEILKFKNMESQILISTTVIEVGVNIPNANVIVINNAERFGIAQLHQLRGRVGRGQYQSYCILKSLFKENERLKAVCNSTDGFEIAQADLQLRGPGDLVGTKQSGENRFMNLVLAMPNLFEHTKKYADWMLNENYGKNLRDLYEEYEIYQEKGD